MMKNGTTTEEEQASLTYNVSSAYGSSNTAEKAPQLHYQLYSRRWLVLLSFCCLNLSNGWIWITWSPLTALMADHWGVSVAKVDALSGVYMYVFVPINVGSMWLVANYWGLAKGLYMGATLNLMGAIVRYYNSSDYEVIYAGTLLCAVGQTFILPMAPLLSGNWFGVFERATATSLGALASQLGTLLGLGSTVLFEFRMANGDAIDVHKLDRYLLVQLLVALLAAGMAFVNLTDQPPTPPSEAAAAILQNSGAGLAVKYRDSIRRIVKCSSSRAFFLLFGLSMGVFYAIPTFLSQFMPLWSPRDQGLLGGIFQIAAVLGCFAAGKLVAAFQLQYQKIGLLLLGGGLASIGMYLVSVYQQSHLAFAACGGLGFFFSSFMAVGIEFGTALTYPADEAAVYGILDSTGELGGFLLVTVGGYLSHLNMDVFFVAICVGLVASSFIMLWHLDGTSRRPATLTL